MTALENIQATARARRDIAGRGQWRRNRRKWEMIDIFTAPDFYYSIAYNSPRLNGSRSYWRFI